MREYKSLAEMGNLGLALFVSDIHRKGVFSDRCHVLTGYVFEQKQGCLA
jgi:hypothetical protein